MFERVVEVGLVLFSCACVFVCVLLSCFVLQKTLALNASDTHISFLPLAHMYEQLLQVRFTGALSSPERILRAAPF